MNVINKVWICEAGHADPSNAGDGWCTRCKGGECEELSLDALARCVQACRDIEAGGFVNVAQPSRIAREALGSL